MSKSIGGDLFAKLGVLSLPFPVPSFYSFSLPFPPMSSLRSHLLNPAVDLGAL